MGIMIYLIESVLSLKKIIGILRIKGVNMKIFGYRNDEEESKLLNLSEVSILTSPQKLRILAQFFLKSAEEIEELQPKSPGEYHSHFRDFWNDWKDDFGDIIIASE